jgi:hypothetical protein
MYEIRIYRTPEHRKGGKVIGANKTRITTIKKSGKWFGLFGWLRLWFTLRKSRLRMEDQYRSIAADCSTGIIH